MTTERSVQTNCFYSVGDTVSVQVLFVLLPIGGSTV